MTKSPMTDFEKQRRMDLDEEARRLAAETDNIYVTHLGEFDEDPFTYTKQLLTTLCLVTGRPVPSDNEIIKIIERVKNNSDKNSDH